MYIYGMVRADLDKTSIYAKENESVVRQIVPLLL